ncbi:MAG: SLC13 family permease [Candidatus Aminicenantales bacterium]
MSQVIIFATLFLAIILFIWGRWRYDIVAVMALLLATIAGIVPADEAFLGFGHPAVITVVAVLILGRGLTNSGLVDELAHQLSKVGKKPWVQVVSLTSVVAFLSAFINNVGAIAIILPVAVQIARKNKRSPFYLLMPIAFGSLLGGLTTMIGTPPNIIIALARAKTGSPPFGMFDFTPVGLGVAVAGIVFISVVGWRLVPERKGQASREELFHIEDYLTEVRVSKGSPLAGAQLSALSQFKDVEVNVIGIARGKRRIIAPSAHEYLDEGDILVIEADSGDLKSLIRAARLDLAEDKKLGNDILKSEEMGLSEAIVTGNSMIIGKTAYSLNLRQKFGLNLLAVARKGRRLKSRLASLRFQNGDILLFSGAMETVHETLRQLGCIPLARREIGVRQPQKALLGAAIFLGAVGSAALGLLPIQVALVLAVVLMVLSGLISMRELYESVDWSVIVLLGALIPVGRALETSGGAGTIAHQFLVLTHGMSPAVPLVGLLSWTTLLSNIINNAATAVLMAPIAVNIASALSVSPDPFLMSVAIGASCAFLTPIGHQSNTLVMGPAGYRFGDYWRMGLPLQILIVLIAVPLILWIWPF